MFEFDYYDMSDYASANMPTGDFDAPVVFETAELGDAAPADAPPVMTQAVEGEEGAGLAQDGFAPEVQPDAPLMDAPLMDAPLSDAPVMADVASAPADAPVFLETDFNAAPMDDMVFPALDLAAADAAPVEMGFDMGFDMGLDMGSALNTDPFSELTVDMGSDLGLDMGAIFDAPVAEVQPVLTEVETPMVEPAVDLVGQPAEADYDWAA